MREREKDGGGGGGGELKGRLEARRGEIEKGWRERGDRKIDWEENGGVIEKGGGGGTREG